MVTERHPLNYIVLRNIMKIYMLNDENDDKKTASCTLLDLVKHVRNLTDLEFDTVSDLELNHQYRLVNTSVIITRVN